MRFLTVLVLAASCAGPRLEQPNSGAEELQRVRSERALNAQVPSMVDRAGQEDWEVKNRERANQERAEARSKQCELDCDARRAACEAQCAEDAQCLSRCPPALPCRAKCR
jgi:hypothetical protein